VEVEFERKRACHKASVFREPPSARGRSEQRRGGSAETRRLEDVGVDHPCPRGGADGSTFLIDPVGKRDGREPPHAGAMSKTRAMRQGQPPISRAAPPPPAPSAGF